MSDTYWSNLEIETSIHQGLSRGCMQARESVYRKFERPVFTLCKRMLGHEADALDCTQDTFVKVFTRYHQYRQDAPFWSWVRRITANSALDRLRNRNRLVFCEEQTVISLADSGSDEKTVSMTSIADQDQLNRAFKQLSDTHRSVVWLYDVEGFSHKEIAQMFDRSLSFSKTTLLRAHQRMREFLTSEKKDSQVPLEAPLAQI